MTPFAWPLSMCIAWPVLAFHTLTVWSEPPAGRGPGGWYHGPPPLTISLPSGLNATLLTQPSCPLSVSNLRPVLASHTFTDLSQLLLTIRLPSGLNTTPVTLFACPMRGTRLSVRITRPVLASHTLTILPPPLTISLLSGLNATLLTLPLCPLSVSRSSPVSTSHTFTEWSWLPLTIDFPFGLNATLVILPPPSSPLIANRRFKLNAN